MTLPLFACSPQVQEYRDGDRTPRLEKNIFHTKDDAPLPYRTWGTNKKSRAVIVALHGFNDYSHAFEGAGKFFAKRGIATYAYDQRGFGASPQTGIWADERNLTADLKQFVGALKKRYPDRPLYILGESMGGAVTIAALSQPDFPRVDGVILVAPAVWGGETMSPFLRATSWLMAHTFPYATFSGRDLKIRPSDNVEMLRALGRDPLIIKRSRADTIYGLVTMMDSGYEKAGGVKVPVLILYGKNDQVIPETPVRNTAERLRGRGPFAYYPDGYHMLLRDLQGEVVLEDIASWIKNPKTKLPSGFEE